MLVLLFFPFVASFFAREDARRLDQGGRIFVGGYENVFFLNLVFVFLLGLFAGFLFLRRRRSETFGDEDDPGRGLGQEDPVSDGVEVVAAIEAVEDAGVEEADVASRRS